MCADMIVQELHSRRLFLSPLRESDAADDVAFCAAKYKVFVNRKDLTFVA